MESRLGQAMQARDPVCLEVRRRQEAGPTVDGVNSLLHCFGTFQYMIKSCRICIINRMWVPSLLLAGQMKHSCQIPNPAVITPTPNPAVLETSDPSPRIYDLKASEACSSELSASVPRFSALLR